ncbi:MAG: hypothetical protein RRA94_14555, partial [Bacteroidota bacterium]|nr:hypothetical protein [Bacteroidota bacterium]
MQSPGRSTSSPVTSPLVGRTSRLLILTALLLLLLRPAAAQDVDRSTPRETFRSFLVNMIVYSSDTTEAARSKAMRAAMRTLDLDDIPAALRESQGADVARDLKSFLDRYELVDLDEIPAAYDGAVYVWRKPAANTEVALTRDEDSLWVFTRRTVASLPVLL